MSRNTNSSTNSLNGAAAIPESATVLAAQRNIEHGRPARLMRLPRVRTLLALLATLVVIGVVSSGAAIYVRHQFVRNLQGRFSISFHAFGSEWMREWTGPQLTEWLGAIQSVSLDNTPSCLNFLRRRAYFQSLESLRLFPGDGRRPEFDHALSLVTALPQLNDVTIFEGRVSRHGLASLTTLTELRELQFLDVHIPPEDAEQLGLLTQVTRLTLNGKNVSDRHVSHLAALDQLQVLKLHGTCVTGPGLAPLRNLKKLNALGLNGTRVSAPGIAVLNELSTLEMLALADSSVTDADLDEFDGCQHLTWLNLAGNPVSDAAITRFVELHPHLKNLALDGTKVTRKCIERLTREHGVSVFSARGMFCGDHPLL